MTNELPYHDDYFLEDKVDIFFKGENLNVDPKQYLQMMSIEGTYGGHRELLALSKNFNFTATVHRLGTQLTVGNGKSPCHIAYMAQFHYDAVKLPHAFVFSQNFSIPQLIWNEFYRHQAPNMSQNISTKQIQRTSQKIPVRQSSQSGENIQHDSFSQMISQKDSKDSVVPKLIKKVSNFRQKRISVLVRSLTSFNLFLYNWKTLYNMINRRKLKTRHVDCHTRSKFLLCRKSVIFLFNRMNQKRKNKKDYV